MHSPSQCLPCSITHVPGCAGCLPPPPPSPTHALAVAAGNSPKAAGQVLLCNTQHAMQTCILTPEWCWYCWWKPVQPNLTLERCALCSQHLLHSPRHLLRQPSLCSSPAHGLLHSLALHHLRPTHSNIVHNTVHNMGMSCNVPLSTPTSDNAKGVQAPPSRLDVHSALEN
jgi:hypothetical protein